MFSLTRNKKDKQKSQCRKPFMFFENQKPFRDKNRAENVRSTSALSSIPGQPIRECGRQNTGSFAKGRANGPADPARERFSFSL